MFRPACHSWTSCGQHHQPHTCSTVCALALWKADTGTDCCLLLLSSPSSATVLTLASLCMMGEGGAALPRLWDLSSGWQHRRAPVRPLERGSSTTARLGAGTNLRQGHAGQQDHHQRFRPAGIPDWPKDKGQTCWQPIR